ncbi:MULTISPECIES: phage terminase large subunit [Eisenbergiella]|uniref:phage terminase large subunit n=1 Tax=Eisenbergiella TaxID=1432051 RepID=UPI0023F4A1E6|nr:MULTISPECIES: phage terminase large subunit [Eisenbergiella]MCI6709848.1 phage terminase large subunit [Eisenbergiella massiliensis]MDY5529331.1 phage terminase large subunit [Eisenbergiella porci]
MNIPAPFSERQEDYLYRCFDSWFNVAEGGKRGGKNVLQTLIFCMLLEKHSNKLHLVAGVSTATAKLNILDCDGYGLLNYFEGRFREGKYKDRDCVRVQTPTGEKIVLVSGGGKDGDEKLIKGNTYGMAYVTEANECHPKFLKEVFDRTLSSNDRKVFHDLNPKEEEHWYYMDILKYHEEQQEHDASYGYNYGHFTIADNYSISDDKLRAVLKTYRKGTVWYERDILGRRAVAEGIIFRYFADNPEPYLYTDAQLQEWYAVRIRQARQGGRRKWLDKITIGIDFGGNGSMTTYIATGYIGYHTLYVMEEDHLPVTQEVDSKRICDKFVEFYGRIIGQYGDVDWVFPDSASTTMINSLRSAAREAGMPWRNIAGCKKNEISERPKTVDLLFNTGRLLINRRCPMLIAAIKKLRWDDDHPDQPEDKNIGNCNDWWDGFCYSWLDFVKYIDLDR